MNWETPLITLEQGDEFYYQEELDFVMNDDYEAEDWLKNNMDYSDFENVIVVEKSNNAVDVDWCNAESEIIEKDLVEKENEK